MRFTKPTKTRLPKEARSIPYKARGDEKLWKCWNCGFICNSDRDDHTGSHAGDNHDIAVTTALGGEGLDGMIIPTEIGVETVIMKQDSNGDDATVHHNYTSDVTKGCPMCGSTNYKG